jgi:hypothetical protein
MSICHQDWVGRPAGEVIPFGELWRESRDGKRRTRHFLPRMLVPDQACRKPEYMRGRWTLYEEQFPSVMSAVLGESEHFGHQANVDMAAWGAQLERQWLREHDVEEGIA